jgi:hypothetical protein
MSRAPSDSRRSTYGGAASSCRAPSGSRRSTYGGAASSCRAPSGSRRSTYGGAASSDWTSARRGVAGNARFAPGSDARRAKLLFYVAIRIVCARGERQQRR